MNKCTSLLREIIGDCELNEINCSHSICHSNCCHWPHLQAWEWVKPYKMIPRPTIDDYELGTIRITFVHGSIYT